MATATTFPSARTYVGVFLETIQGTEGAPSMTIPLDKFDPEDSVTWLTDSAMRGSMAEAFDEIAGPIQSGCSLGGPAYADSIGWSLGNILGDVATTGAGAPFSHAMALLNSGQAQPKSVCFADYQGVTATSGARYWRGQMFASVTLKFTADGLFTWEGATVGWPSKPVPTTAPTSTLTGIQALANWRLKVGIAGPASGGTLVTNVADGEVTITRALKVYNSADGDQNPYIVRAGKVDVTGKLSFIASDETPLTNYLTNAQPRLQLVLDNGGAGAAQTTLTLNMTKAAYKTGKVDRGEEAVMIPVDFRAIPTSTDAGASAGLSPLKVTLANAQPASTYQ